MIHTYGTGWKYTQETSCEEIDFYDVCQCHQKFIFFMSLTL